MFLRHRFIYAALMVLAVTPSIVLAERTANPRQQRNVFVQTTVKTISKDGTNKVESTPLVDIKKNDNNNVAVLSRGGKVEKAAKSSSSSMSSSLVSQSASILMGLILALNSGFINGCALSGVVTADGSSQAVAAVTASWTNSAMGLASGNMAKFGFLSKVLGSFIFGSLLAGYLQPKPTQFLISTSSYGLPLLLAAAFTGLSKTFLETSTSVKLGFYLLCMANGINNSVTSTMTSNLCRTSHFTGISSDMGTFLGQILRGNTTNLFKLKVFAALAASFWTGGFLSYEFSKTYGASILYVPAAVYLLMAVGYENFAKSVFA